MNNAEATARHWHVGSNRPGFMPDNPDSVSTAHTPQDAFLNLLGDLNSHSEFLADNDESDFRIDQAVAEFDEMLPFFDEHGNAQFMGTDGDICWTPDETTRGHLLSLDNNLTVVASDNSVCFWSRSCIENCAD